jgi:hypothetical protein
MGWEENGGENHLNELFSVSEAGRKQPFYFSSSLYAQARPYLQPLCFKGCFLPFKLHDNIKILFLYLKNIFKNY